MTIGDIGHTPGALSLFDKYFPEAEITLRPRSLGHGARELMTKNFPRLKIAEGNVGQDGKPTSPPIWANSMTSPPARRSACMRCRPGASA